MTKVVEDIESGKKEEIQAVIRTEVERKVEEAPRERFHFGVPQSKLGVMNPDKNYHYHWINDTPGRIDMAQAGGYQFVPKGEVTLLPGVVSKDSDLGDRVSAVVGRNEDGTPLRAYLMKIRLEWYEESQALLQAKSDATDKAIRAGRTSGQEDGNFYIPKGQPIKMSNNLDS